MQDVLHFRASLIHLRRIVSGPFFCLAHCHGVDFAVQFNPLVRHFRPPCLWIMSSRCRNLRCFSRLSRSPWSSSVRRSMASRSASSCVCALPRFGILIAVIVAPCVVENRIPRPGRHSHRVHCRTQPRQFGRGKFVAVRSGFEPDCMFLCHAGNRRPCAFPPRRRTLKKLSVLDGYVWRAFGQQNHYVPSVAVGASACAEIVNDICVDAFSLGCFFGPSIYIFSICFHFVPHVLLLIVESGAGASMINSLPGRRCWVRWAGRAGARTRASFPDNPGYSIAGAYTKSVAVKSRLI